MAYDNTRRRRGMTKPDAATLRDLYEVQRLNSVAIARRFHVRQPTAMEWLREAGIIRRGRWLPAEIQYRFDEATVRRLYEDEALPVYQVAERLGVPDGAIRAYLKRIGIRIRPASYPGKVAHRWPSEAVLRDLYEARRLTTREIAEQFSVDFSTVRRWFAFYGIKRRKRFERRPSRFVPPVTKEELARLLHVECLGFHEVATRFGVCHSTPAQWAKFYGIDPPTAWQSRYSTPQPNFETEEVRTLYESGYSLSDIGAMFGVSHHPIRNALRRMGVPIRPKLYNRNNGSPYRARCGLSCRSSYEMRVADWLSDRGLRFRYEPRYPFNRTLFADFLVNGWYVEIWGIPTSPTYRKQRRRKVRLCRIHGVPLIQVDVRHFRKERGQQLDAVLSQALMPTGSQGWLPFMTG